MIRLIQRKLIIPRGDTGSFNIPAIAAASNSDVAIFTIFDCTTKTKLFQKSIAATSDVLTFEFTHNDTVNLPPGNYVWDIKFYKNPVYADEELVNGEEIDSYYAGYSLPACEIRETSDNFLVNNEAPSATLTPAQLDIISAALASMSQAVTNTEENVSHYPVIRNNTWYVWDASTDDYVSTGVSANGIVGNGISGITKTNTAGLVDTYTISFTDGSAATFTVTNGESGVYVGTEAPTNPNVNVWINPEGEGIVLQSMQLHICSAAEYDAQTGVPTVAMPDAATFYLVPGGETNNLYVEWVYMNGAWEQFGSASIDLSGYATVADTVLTSTLSKGRKANTTVGVGSFAFGNNVEASGLHAHAEGLYTIASGIGAHAEGGFPNDAGITTASGNYSHAEGQHTTASNQAAHSEGINTTASGSYCHAEGRNTTASGASTHAEGFNTQANGKYSHAEGQNTISAGQASHAGGAYNVEDSYENWPLWVSGTSYAVGDKVKIRASTGSREFDLGYICTVANNDASMDMDKWSQREEKMNFVEIIGNGTNVARSNAYALTWTGDGHYAGDVYVGCNADSSGGTKLAKLTDVTVSDVQVNGTSVVTNGVANVPRMSDNNFGVAKTANNNGIIVDNGGSLRIGAADNTDVKKLSGPTSLYKPVCPAKLDAGVFYALAKAAGADMKDIASTTVGQYPEAQKSAISDMLTAPVSVSGSTPSITAKSGISYVCGEVASLAITVPESGCFDVVFESGSTPTALTLTLPTGYTLEWLGGFDDTSLDASTTYEINVRVVGTKCLGVAGKWT